MKVESYSLESGMRSCTFNYAIALRGAEPREQLSTSLSQGCCHMEIMDPSPIHHLKPSLTSSQELQMLCYTKLGSWPRLESKKSPKGHGNKKDYENSYFLGLSLLLASPISTISSPCHSCPTNTSSSYVGFCQLWIEGEGMHSSHMWGWLGGVPSP